MRQIYPWYMSVMACPPETHPTTVYTMYKVLRFKMRLLECQGEEQHDINKSFVKLRTYSFTQTQEFSALKHTAPIS